MAQGRLSWVCSAWKLRLKDLQTSNIEWMVTENKEPDSSFKRQQASCSKWMYIRQKFALKMLQTGSQRGSWMPISGNTQHMTGHSPEKLPTTFKVSPASVRRLTQMTSTSPPNLNYSMILKTVKINASFVVWLTKHMDICLPYAVWLHSNPFR